MNNYELAEKDYKNRMKYKEIADKYGVTINTVKSWKQRYNWSRESAEKKTSVCTQNQKSMHTKKEILSKQKKELARVMIEEGHTLKEASALSGTSIDTLKKISSKENLQQTQLENLKKYKEKVRDKIRGNKDRRLMLNEEILNSLEYEIKNWREKGNIPKTTIEKLILSEEMEQKTLELDRIERLEKIELEKQRIDLEMNKFLTIAKLKTLELVTKDTGIKKSDIDEFEKEMNGWTLEVWKNEK